MATRNVISRMAGSSLIELMIASLVGGMALAIVGTVFITGQRSAAQRSQEILLLQNLTNVMQVMKEDMYQAGFDDVQRKSVRLSGASQVVYTQHSPPLVGYVYRVISGASGVYRHVVYRQESDVSGVLSLKLCEKMQPNPLTIASAADSGFGGNCYSLFDPQQISVTEFSARSEILSGGNVSGALTTVTLSAKLTEHPSVAGSLSFQIQQRNWQ